MGCRDTSKGEAAAASMGAPKNVNPIQLDISDDSSIEHCLKTIEQIFGRLDVLINNAGTAGLDLKQGGATPTVRESWQHVIDINTISTGVFTEAMLPLLQHSKDPKIVFISSTLGSIGTMFKNGKSAAPQVPYYNASKAAINHYAAQLALTYPSIKVNACCPGLRGTGLNNMSKEGSLNPALGAVNAVRLATDTTGITGTYSNSEGPIPW